MFLTFPRETREGKKKKEKQKNRKIIQTIRSGSNKSLQDRSRSGRSSVIKNDESREYIETCAKICADTAVFKRHEFTIDKRKKKETKKKNQYCYLNIFQFNLHFAVSFQ